MNMKQAKSEFLLACRADGLRPATVTWYGSILRPLVEHFAGCNLEDITTKQMRLYIVGLQERETRYTEQIQKPAQKGGLSRDSIASHVTGLHRFFNWCSEEYKIDNPMKNIRRPKKAPKAPKAINPSDLVKLFESYRSHKPLYGAFLLVVNLWKRPSVAACYALDVPHVGFNAGYFLKQVLHFINHF